ncbi:MAG: DUF3822 family protein [Flavobacteriaceae bacterium]|jgi:hypothetical protein|nr:DUF3822 family protein [Flavobacteriaceae bacterium]MBT4959024.1 DUF3822 family protein [Flavobacteriaceae bacterium]MBT6447533.1 DUF3822 family protein [Flavobacteriaceae bacterium]MDG1830952.1 DUF3822 family protein [Flavobacteriaceae bacterium]
MVIGQQPMMQSQEIKIEASTLLTIKLSSFNATLVLSNSFDDSIIQCFNYNFDEKIPPEKLSKKLNTILKESEINKSDIINVKLIICNKLSSLVPGNLFEEKLSLEYLKFNSKLLENDFAAHDLIEEIDAVNVYLPYVNVNNYILENFGSFDFYHYSTLLIKKLIKYNKGKESCLYANLQEEDFQVLIIKKNKLLYYNNFDFNKKEDILYFLLFVIEQNKIDSNKSKLYLIGKINVKSEAYLLISKFIDNIEIIDFKENYINKVHMLENDTEIDFLII